MVNSLDSPDRCCEVNFVGVEHFKSGKAWAQTSCEVDVR